MRKLLLFVIGALVLLSGCAHVISRDVLKEVDREITFAELRENAQLIGYGFQGQPDLRVLEKDLHIDGGHSRVCRPDNLLPLHVAPVLCESLQCKDDGGGGYCYKSTVSLP